MPIHLTWPDGLLQHIEDLVICGNWLGEVEEVLLSYGVHCHRLTSWRRYLRRLKEKRTINLSKCTISDPAFGSENKQCARHSADPLAFVHELRFDRNSSIPIGRIINKSI